MTKNSLPGMQRDLSEVGMPVDCSEMTSKKNYEVQYKNVKGGKWISAGGTNTWQAGILKSEKLALTGFVTEIRMFNILPGVVLEYWRKVE